jgi:hypothetical protein
VNSPGGPDTPGESDPVLYLEPQFLDFGYSTESLSFNIKNTGSGTLYWAIMEDYQWIDCSETEGESNGETIPVMVDVNRTAEKLPPENHAFLDVYWNKGIEQIEVLVLMPSDDQIIGRVYYVSNSVEVPVEWADVTVNDVWQCKTDKNGEFVLNYTDPDIELLVEYPQFEPYYYLGKVLPVFSIPLDPL